MGTELTNTQPIVRRLQAAQRIFVNPDRHTHAELAYAEQRVRELGPDYMEQVGGAITEWGRTVRQSFDEMVTQLAPVIRRLAAAIEREYPQDRAPRRRAELRASRRRAMLSTQVSRHRRQRAAR